jgi:hypothetical protein
VQSLGGPIVSGQATQLIPRANSGARGATHQLPRSCGWAKLHGIDCLDAFQG